MCCVALEKGTSPSASDRTAAFNSQTMDAAAARQAALQHMLGIIRLPDDEGGMRRAARLSAPVLRTVAAMGRAAETASIRDTTQAVQRSLSRVRVRAAFTRLDVYAKFRARHPACRTTFRVSPMPVARIARAGTSIRSSRHWVLPLPNEITRAVTITSPRTAVGLILAMLKDETARSSRYCRLAELDARLRSQADAPAAAANHDADALQIVIDALPAAGDQPVALPQATRSGARTMAVPMDGELHALHATLVCERDAGRERAGTMRASPATVADASFMVRWTTFWQSAKLQAARAIRARARAEREAASAPVSAPDHCAAAAAAARRACALATKCRRRADEARARARLQVTQHTAPAGTRARPLRCGTAAARVPFPPPAPAVRPAVITAAASGDSDVHDVQAPTRAGKRPLPVTGAAQRRVVVRRVAPSGAKGGGRDAGGGGDWRGVIAEHVSVCDALSTLPAVVRARATGGELVGSIARDEETLSGGGAVPACCLGLCAP